MTSPANAPAKHRDEYTCAACGGTFEKRWSDEEALAELANQHPDIPQEKCVIVCDDCWHKMGFGQ